MKFTSLIKPVSLLLVACLMTESTLGSLAESNIWKERQKARQSQKESIERPTQLASFPLQLPEISKFDVIARPLFGRSNLINPIHEIASSLKNAPRNDKSLEFLARLPASLGSIRKIS